MNTQTRLQLRQDIADQLDDLVLGTVTATGATSVTVPEAVAPEGDWEGGEIYVYAGTGIGQARTITASGDYTGVLTVAAWTTQPVAASVELHRRKTVAQYNAAINRAIRQARGVYVEVEDSTLVQAADTTEYAVPASLLWLQEIDTEDAEDAGTYTLLDPSAWSVDAGRLLLPAPVDGALLRLRGLREPALLDTDSAVCEVDPAYVLFAACSLLAAADIRAPALDRQASAATSGYYQQLAQVHLRKNALQNARRVRL